MDIGHIISNVISKDHNRISAHRLTAVCATRGCLCNCLAGKPCAVYKHFFSGLAAHPAQVSGTVWPFDQAQGRLRVFSAPGRVRACADGSSFAHRVEAPGTNPNTPVGRVYRDLPRKCSGDGIPLGYASAAPGQVHSNNACRWATRLPTNLQKTLQVSILDIEYV